MSEAEARTAAASDEAAARTEAVAAAGKRYAASARAAAQPQAAARAAKRRAAALERRGQRRQAAAAARVTQLEDDRQQAEDDHGNLVSGGLGFALAALVAAAIAFGWARFRASAPVTALTRVSLGQAIGLCVGGGLLVLIVGAAMFGEGGFLSFLGAALVFLAFVLANALVLARHSVAVEGGRAKPVLGRKRLPRRAGQVTAAVFAGLCLLSLGTAVFAGEDESSEASAALRLVAAGKGPGESAAAAARARAARLSRAAAAPVARADADRADLRASRRRLVAAKSRLERAEGDYRQFTRQLAAQVKSEEREAEAAERKLAREQQEAEELAVEESNANCDPNYSGCLDPTASDYDCEGGSGDGPLYTGTVEVLGYDEYGLDSDGDGIGCED